MIIAGCGLSYWAEGGCMTRRLAFSSCPHSFWLVLVVTAMLSTSAAAGRLGIPTLNFRADGGGEKEIAPLSSRSLYWFHPQMLQQSKRNQEVQPIQLCGYRLLEAVRGLCRGNFVGISRRSDPDMADERMTMPRMQDSPSTERLPNQFLTNQDEQGQQLSPAKVESMHFRFRRNIIDDCCKKPCSISQMLRYCGKK